MGVIEALEIIEIEHHDTETQGARLRSEQLGRRPIKAPTVAQAGERIGGGLQGIYRQPVDEYLSAEWYRQDSGAEHQ